MFEKQTQRERERETTNFIEANKMNDIIDEFANEKEQWKQLLQHNY